MQNFSHVASSSSRTSSAVTSDSNNSLRNFEEVGIYLEDRSKRVKPLLSDSWSK
ncbi:hypothetical protein MKX01_032882, partial [Papaver californicum]